MMESRSIKKAAKWPREDLTGSSVQSVRKACIQASAKTIQELPKSIRLNKFRARPIELSTFLPLLTVSSHSTLLCASRTRTSNNCVSTEASGSKTQSRSVNGNRVVLAYQPKTNLKKYELPSNSIRVNEDDISLKKEEDISGKTKCFLNSLKPINIAQEDLWFFNSSFTHNPQFKDENPALPDDLAYQPKANLKKRELPNSIRVKEDDISWKKEEDISGKTKCFLSSLKPINIAQEKRRFFNSSFTHNPQFKYENPALPDDLKKHSIASNRFLKQAIDIMDRAINKYGSYSEFEKATGGSLLSKRQILLHAEQYMKKEGCLGEIAVHLSEDMIPQAYMSEVKGQPTMTINVSVAREKWLEGTLRHEIGTHYYRMVNNKQQPWYNSHGREQYNLKPCNPTEEGLASLHTVLTEENPFLWRAALLYYTVYQASQMSFSELFKDLGRFMENPNTRWHYCMRAKRGCTDTSQPGCCSKDQVYLDGILHILRHRDTIDFRLLMCMGKVSYEDIHRLKQFAVFPDAKIPLFLKNQGQYMKHLLNIMKVNGLTDKKLRKLIK
ncbi:putative tyrosine carboxypeptidase MATCAP2 [Pseudophryne corroboree]|uniref:putative tyrosine carboxypeptidase MATCAP2 n=1 Tax=Pseudophryne corroboree TaxID=495146 RepID=UPI003081EA9A